MKKNTLRSIIAILLVMSLTISMKPALAFNSLEQATEPPTEVTTVAPTESPTEVPSTSDFSLSVDSSAKTGIPGSIVTYTVTVKNLGSTDLDVTIGTPLSVSSWSPAPTVEQSSLSIPASGSSSFTLDVPVPSDATAGQNDKERVTVSAGANSKTIDVTTTVKATVVAGRPVILVSSYSLDSGRLAADQDFNLDVKLENVGDSIARNIVIAYDGGTSMYVKGSGGVDSVSSIAAGKSKTIDQDFVGASDLSASSMATLKVTITYTDSAGTSYSDVFTLNLNASSGSGTGYSATSTAVADQPQLVVTGYSADVDLLQPGTTFNLKLDVQNMGRTDASAVTMILGGGGTSSSSDSGTPVSGGVSGSSSELTNFAPLNSSNLVFIGDIKRGSSISLTQKLIVNVSTAPGVYTLKISFAYTDSKGNRVVDDQVITLLVYSLPKLEVNYYRDPGIVYANTESILPIQVTNLGKSSCVLGNMTVTASGEQVTNNVSLVGTLDSGGYYTMDVNLLPQSTGPIEVLVSINYNDDFNQPRTFEQKLTVDVQPSVEITPEPGAVDENGNPISDTTNGSSSETGWHKLLRFCKGLLGLDSSAPSEEIPATETAPITVSTKG